MSLKPVISTFLKESRSSKNMTQDEYAKFLGIPKRTYLSYEYGDSGVSSKKLLSIAKKLKVAPEDIHFDNEEEIKKSIDSNERINGKISFFLKKRRTESGKTQSEFADFLEIPFRTYIGYEYGESTPRPLVLEKISAKLNCGVHELFATEEISKGKARYLEPSGDEALQALSVFPASFLVRFQEASLEKRNYIQCLFGIQKPDEPEKSMVLQEIFETISDIPDVENLQTALEFIKTIHKKSRMESQNNKKQSS